ncbi:MAG: Iron-sulfur cluster regulator IscR [Micavibrio sp.]|nr:Iron-sulfur cluster regulator IscR [Micavibrio sp.]
MIKLSRFADYAVVILAEMAGDANARLAASDLSKRINLPEPTVAKILKFLTKGGILSSTRGVNGGYGLTRAAQAITVADIITAMEGPISLTECADTKSTCALEGHCAMNGRWGKVNMAVRTALQSVTLVDLMQSSSPRKQAITATRDNALAGEGI